MIAAQRVCAAGDLAPAAAMAATVTGPDGEIALVVARDSDGTWHALDRMCTHGEVSLAEGDVDKARSLGPLGGAGSTALLTRQAYAEVLMAAPITEVNVPISAGVPPVLRSTVRRVMTSTSGKTV